MNNLIKKMTLLLIISLSINCHGQQEPLYSLFWKNYSTYNPAHSGDKHKLYTNLQFRKQWVDLPSNITTLNAIADYRIDPDHHSVGIALTYDDLDIEKSQRVNLNYSYAMNIAAGRLSVGIAPSIKFAQTQSGWIIISPQPGPSPSPSQTTNSTLFDINTGIAFTSKKISTGIGLVNILGSSDAFYNNSPHVFGHFDYEFGNSATYSVTTRYYLRTDLTSVQNEFNVMNTFLDTYLLGVSYRTPVGYGSGVGVMAGIRLFNKLEANYQFEYHPSSNFSPGSSHEISLSFYLD
jgi:type IX secretion system PorP/SprF family membrane protein